MNHNLKKRLPVLIIFLLLAGGLALVAYPTVSDWLFQYTAKAEIADYEAAVSQESVEELETMRQEAGQYNAALTGQESSLYRYEDLLGVDEVIGYLEIPRLSVYLPIYHGQDEEILEKGIGHVLETSLPVGGTSTHCVLSGHSGLPAAKLLTGLDQMEEGDLFYLHVLDEVLAYRVDQKKVVLPDETDDLGIVEGKDYVTLVTCTPYGINTHRLLVRGERTTYEPQTISFTIPEKQPVAPEKLRFYLMLAAGLLCLLISLLILFVPTRKGEEAGNEHKKNGH
jgi:sortase A